VPDFGNLFVAIRWEHLEPVPAVQGDRNLKYVGFWKSWPPEMEKMQTSRARWVGHPANECQSVPVPPHYTADKTQPSPVASSSSGTCWAENQSKITAPDKQESIMFQTKAANV